jgi:predicted O-methyltransferase YrrM
MSATFHNVNAVLVHERQDVVLDLVRNLRFLDPESTILLYNGGRDRSLLAPFLASGDDAVLVHPRPRPLAWGRLHDFALDCMRFALDTMRFDTLTIVDSDQLATRRGYSARLCAHLAGRDGVGMLGNAPGVQPRTTRIGPPAAAVEELEAWRPFLRRFDGGEEKFPHWTFWPATVFTEIAARELTTLFDRDRELQRLVAHTKIWATEEVILPTLVALVGLDVEQSPCSYDFVKYNARYLPRQVSVALGRSDVHWIHPVARRFDDVLRRRVRTRFDAYEQPGPPAVPADASPTLLRRPILRRMRTVEGWLEDDEAELLIATTARALSGQREPQAIVEIGSYCGRSTIVLGSVARALAPTVKVYAVDPHDGNVGALDQGLQHTAPTLGRFTANIAAAELTGVVETILQRAQDVPWERPIGMLFVDGLHDYASVARDFRHFEEHVVPGGFVAFHDYADYYPGVKMLVHEILATRRYARVELVRSMMVLQKRAAAAERGPLHAAHPLVTCVLPTFDRPEFVTRAVEYFLRQDYEPRRLIVVDDGSESICHLLPADERIEHVRLDRRQTIGAKRNAGCEAASGELIANWDDDDWMSPHRLTSQVQALLSGGGDVCGLNRMLYYEPASDRAWRYVYPWDLSTWASDGTLLYTREFWRTNPFPDTSMGLDIRFLRPGRFRKLVPLEDETVYVGMIHRGNTSPKHTSRSVWQPFPSERIHRLLGADLSFYAPAAEAAAR